MATLQLDKLWINLLSTGEGVAGYTMEGRQVTYEKRGEVRIGAGGNSRSFTRKGVIGSVSFVFRDMTRAQIDTLRLWAGLPVQVRDDRGRVWTGTYYSVPENEHRKHEETLFEVPMTVQTVTVIVGV